MITTDTQKQLTLDGIDPLVFNEFTVRKRDGREAGFEPERIRIAIEKAFRAEYGSRAVTRSSPSCRMRWCRSPRAWSPTWSRARSGASCSRSS
ncbi:MAG: ATP cone domain-containing protein [Kiritimatiellia bacterium]